MAKRTTLTAQEAAFVQTQRVGRLATADGDGNPTLVPVCYAFDGTYFYTPLDKKPKRVEGTQLQRVHNIDIRPEVSLLIDLYDDDWSRLAYVLIHAHGKLIMSDDERHTLALALLRERYVQYRTMNLEDSPVILLTPTHVVSWAWSSLFHQSGNTGSSLTQ